MRFDRLLLASAACALVAQTVSAQTASAQTTTTSRSTSTSTQTGAGAGSGQPGAQTSNTTGSDMTSNMSGNSTGAGAMGPSATSGGAQTGGSVTGGPQTGGSMTGGNMTGGAQTGGAMTSGASAGAPFQKITPASGADLLTVLQSSGQFTTLLKAITATNLTAVLQRPGALTVFAPTDAAFAALPAGQLTTLMQPANVSQLQQFVLLHVVNTPITSSELLNHTAINVSTVATGKKVHLDGSSGKIKVDDSAVIQADVKASNGTIQVIDRVLSPSYVPPAAATPSSSGAASPQH